MPFKWVLFIFSVVSCLSTWALPPDRAGATPHLGTLVSAYPSGNRITHLKDWIGHPGDKADFYKFNVWGPPSLQHFRAKLSLRNGARLVLYERTTNYNKPWVYVGSGIRRGFFHTELNASVRPGQYAIGVISGTNIPTVYSLRVCTRNSATNTVCLHMR